MNAKMTTRYQWPMHFEGDKTYDELGDCLVCNRHLASVGSKSNHEKAHVNDEYPQVIKPEIVIVNLFLLHGTSY